MAGEQESRGGCNGKTADQAGLGHAALNKDISKHIFFLPPGVSGACGKKGKSQWFLHYNCQPDKIVKMRMQHDWYADSTARENRTTNETRRCWLKLRLQSRKLRLQSRTRLKPVVKLKLVAISALVAVVAAISL